MTSGGSGNERLMPATPAADVGPLVVETFPIGGRELRLLRPAKPERLLDLAAVAAAYEKDEYMPYWGSLWPVAIKLAEVLLAGPWPAGATAIELGCGLGLPGVAGLLGGLAVTFSDYDETALRFAAESARLNGFAEVPVLAVDWRRPPVGTYDVVIASDLIYEERNVEPLVALFEVMLAPGGTVLAADQNRLWAPKFRQALRRGGFRWEETAFEPASATVPVSGTIYRITR